MTVKPHHSVASLLDTIKLLVAAAEITWPVPEVAVTKYVNRIAVNFDYNHLTTFLRVSSRWAIMPAGMKLNDANPERSFIYVEPENYDINSEHYLNIVPYESFYVAALWDEDETRLAMINHPDGIKAIKDRIQAVKIEIEAGRFNNVEAPVKINVVGKT